MKKFNFRAMRALSGLEARTARWQRSWRQRHGGRQYTEALAIWPLLKCRQRWLMLLHGCDITSSHLLLKCRWKVIVLSQISHQAAFRFCEKVSVPVAHSVAECVNIYSGILHCLEDFALYGKSMHHWVHTVCKFSLFSECHAAFRFGCFGELALCSYKSCSDSWARATCRFTILHHSLVI